MNRRNALIIVMAASVVLVAIFIVNRNTGGPVAETRSYPGTQADHLLEASVAEQAAAQSPATEPSYDAVDPPAPDCDSTNRRKITRSRDEVRSTFFDALQILKKSDNRDDLLAAALIAATWDRQESLMLLRRLGGVGSSRAAVLLLMFELCAGDEAGCDFSLLEQNIRQSHRHNGALWIALAGHYLANGRDDAALAAIRQAVAAPVIGAHVAEQAALLDRALSATTDLSFSERVFYLTELMKREPPQTYRVIDRCRKGAKGTWLEVCEQLADNMLAVGLDIGSQIYGADIKLKAMAARGEETKNSQAANRSETVDALIGNSEQMDEMLNVLMNDEQLLTTFFGNLATLGEAAAFQVLNEDIARLKSTPEYDQCNFIFRPYETL